MLKLFRQLQAIVLNDGVHSGSKNRRDLLAEFQPVRNTQYCGPS
jgi:hypothetical protein